jgi:hypothetical protein
MKMHITKEDAGVQLIVGRHATEQIGEAIAVPILVVTINKGARAGPVAHSGVVGARNIASRAPGATCTADGGNNPKPHNQGCASSATNCRSRFEHPPGKANCCQQRPS